MSDETGTTSSIRDALPAGWRLLLARAASAGAPGLDLDGAREEDVILAERLTDLGVLRVPRAGRYVPTHAGTELLNLGTSDPSPVPKRKPLLLVFLVLFVALVILILWIWMRR